MSDVNEDLIRNLYAKYAPDVDVDSKIGHIQTTYGDNQDSFVENFYRKYSPDTEVSSKLDYINSKYPVNEVKKKEEELVSDSQEEVTESTTEVQDGGSSQASVLEEEVQTPNETEVVVEEQIPGISGTSAPGIIKDPSMRPASEVEQEVFTESISEINKDSDLENIQQTTMRKVVGRDPQGEVMSVNKPGISNTEALSIQENIVTDFANLYIKADEDRFIDGEKVEDNINTSNLYKDKRNLEADIKKIDMEMRSLLQFSTGEKIIPVKVEELRGEDKTNYQNFKLQKESKKKELDIVTKEWSKTSNPLLESNDKSQKIYDPFTGQFVLKINAPAPVIQYTDNVNAEAKKMSETTGEEELLKIRTDLYYDVLNLSKQVKRNKKDVLEERTFLGSIVDEGTGLVNKAANFIGAEFDNPRDKNIELQLENFPNEKDNGFKGIIPQIMSEHPLAKQLNEKLRQFDAVNRAVELNKFPPAEENKSLIDVSGLESGFISTLFGDEYSKNPDISFGSGSNEVKVKVTQAQPLANVLKEKGFSGEAIDELQKSSELTFGEEAQELTGNIGGMVLELYGTGGAVLKSTKIPKVLEAATVFATKQYGTWAGLGMKILAGGTTEGTKFGLTGVMLDKQEEYDPLLGATFGVLSPLAEAGSTLLGKLPAAKVIDDVLSASVPGYNTGKFVVGKGAEAGVTTTVIYAADLFDKSIIKGKEAGIAWDEVVYGKTPENPEGEDPIEKGFKLWTVMLAAGIAQKSTYSKFHDALGKDILEHRGRKIDWKWVKSQAPKPPEGEAYTENMLIESGVESVNKNGTAADKSKLVDIIQDVSYNENLNAAKGQIQDVINQRNRQEKQNSGLKKITKDVLKGEVEPTEVNLDAGEVDSFISSTPAELKNISNSVKSQVKNNNITAAEGQDVINKVTEVMKSSSNIGVQNSKTKSVVIEKINELEGIKAEAEELDKLKFRDEATQKELNSLNERSSEIESELKTISETPETTSELLTDLATNKSRREKTLRNTKWQEDNVELVSEIEAKRREGLGTNQALKELSKEYETKEVDEVETIKDSQIPLSKDIYTIRTEPGEGIRTVEVTVNKDGSRKLEQKVDGVTTAGSQNIPAKNTVSNVDFVSLSFGEIVGTPETLPMEKVMNPKMKDKLTKKQKQDLGISEEVSLEAAEPVELEVIKEDLTIYKGTGGKRNADGTIKTRHPDVKGRFYSEDISTAEKYKGEKEVISDIIPKGATIETVEIDGSKFSPGKAYDQAETDAINASKADVVKLITNDQNGGRQTQIIIKTKQDAVQKSSTEKVDVLQQTKDGKAVAEGDKVKVTTEEVEIKEKKETKIKAEPNSKQAKAETFIERLQKNNVSPKDIIDMAGDFYGPEAAEKALSNMGVKSTTTSKRKFKLKELAQQLRRDSKVSERALDLNKETITKIDEVLKDLEKEYKALGLPKQKYTPAQVRRIIKSSVDTKLTQDSIDKILEGVNEILDPIIRKDNISYLKNTLYSPKKLPKISVESRKKLKEIRDDLKAGDLKNKTTEELKALSEVVTEIITEGKATQAALQRLLDVTRYKKQADVSKELYKKEDFKEIDTIEELDKFFNDNPNGFVLLNNTYEVTPGNYKDFLKDNPFLPLQGTKAYIAIDLKQIQKDYVRNPIRVLRGKINPANQIATIENLMKPLWRGAPEIRKILEPVVKQIKNAYTNNQIARRKYTNMYNKYLSDVFGSKKKGVKELSKTVDGLLNPTSVVVSKRGTTINNGQVGRYIAIQNLYKNRATQMREDAQDLKGTAKDNLLNKAEKFDKILDRSGVNEKEFDKYLEANPKIKEFGDNLYKVFAEMAPDFAPTYEKSTNMVFEEELYVPDNKAGKVDETGIVGATERLKNLDEGGDFITRSALSNRMKDRVDNADPIDLYLDATNMFVSYVRSMSHAKEMMPIAESINEVFNKPNIGAIYQKLGKAKFESLMEALDSQINLNSDPVKSIEKIILELNRFGIVSTLALSVKNIPKQAVSFINYSVAGYKDGINPVDWALGFPKMLSTENGREISVRILQSPYLKERIKKTQVDPLLSKAIDGLDKNSTYNTITSTLQKIAMSPIMMGDAIGVVSGGVPFAVAVHKQKMREGMNFEDAWDYTYKRFVEESNESQQTSADYALGKVARSKLGKLFVTYKTAQTSAMNKFLGAYEDARDWKNLNNNQKKQTIADAIFFSVIWSIPFLAVGNGAVNAFINDEGDEVKERKSVELLLDAINSNLQGLGLPGFVLSTIYNKITERPDSFNDVSVVNIYNNIRKALGYVFENLFEKKNPFDFDNYTKSEKKNIIKVLGFKNANDLYKNFNDGQKSVYDAIMNYQEGKVYPNRLRDYMLGVDPDEENIKPPMKTGYNRPTPPERPTPPGRPTLPERPGRN